MIIIKNNGNYLKRKWKLMLARKLANYRPNMAGITQNKHKCLIFIVVSKAGKILFTLDQNEEKINIKKYINN